MADMVVLMRHGKAKAAVEGQQDFDRELTEAGKRSLAASLEGMLAPINTSLSNVEVWASPAARTMQTAELLCKALKKKGVKVRGGISPHDALWEQDAHAFLAELKASQAEAVVVVGHNPMMEVLPERLVGARIPFSTGALCCMRLNWDVPASAFATDNETGNRLLWFTQGPVSQQWRTLVHMEKTLRSCARNVDARLAAFLDDPDDVETMHKFRVSIRTLRSLVAFVKPWQDAGQNDVLQAELKDIVSVTSRLRELDVLADQARETDGASHALVEFCEAEAADERARVLKTLKTRRTAKAVAHVNAIADDIRWKPAVKRSGLKTQDVRARFDEMANLLEADLRTLDLADVEPTHDVRKAAKRVRYVAENFKDLIGTDAVDVAKGMTAHQDNLGAVCDARVNIDIINAFESRALPDPVAWDLALLRAKNETFLYTTLRNQTAE